MRIDPADLAESIGTLADLDRCTSRVNAACVYAQSGWADTVAQS
jgi:hypothetical protein